MKKVITFLTSLFLLITMFAQTPEKMSYQAVIRDSKSQLVSNQSVGMQISILQGSSNGTAVYVETQKASSNSNGLVSIEIGAGTVESGTFASIDWAKGPYFIKIETDPAGGTDYSITGISQLLSVPYALNAKTAESITGTINETDPAFTKSTAAGISTIDISNWNKKLDSYTETDPAFTKSIAAGILETDTAKWNKKLDSYTETDPAFTKSIAAGISATDTANWNKKKVKKEILISPLMLANSKSISYPPGYSRQLLELPGNKSTSSGNTQIDIPVPSDWDRTDMTVEVYYSASNTGDIKISFTYNPFSLGDAGYKSTGAWTTYTVDNAYTLNKFTSTMYASQFKSTSELVTIQINRYDYDYAGEQNPDTNDGDVYIHGIRIVYYANK